MTILAVLGFLLIWLSTCGYHEAHAQSTHQGDLYGRLLADRLDAQNSHDQAKADFAEALLQAPAPTVPTALALPVVVHYSPAEDLEAIDLAVLDKATHQVDLVLYAFDDKPLANELLTLAKRGVAIRIYRDQQQYLGEVARGKKGGVNLTALFTGQTNVHIRVKGSVALAHLKSYCVDGLVVRDGSANWSPSGEKVQDNSLVLITEPPVVSAFAQNFETLWARPPNQVVQ